MNTEIRSPWLDLKRSNQKVPAAAEFSMSHVRQSQGLQDGLSENQPAVKKKLAVLLPSRRGPRSSPSLQQRYVDQSRQSPPAFGMISTPFQCNMFTQLNRSINSRPYSSESGATVSSIRTCRRP